MSPGATFLAAAYLIFLVSLLAYVAIIAAKLARLRRELMALRAGSHDEP